MYDKNVTAASASQKSATLSRKFGAAAISSRLRGREWRASRPACRPLAPFRVQSRSDGNGDGWDEPPLNIDINPQFARAFELLGSGAGNLFITGKAGTGKSTLLYHYRQIAAVEPVVLAPTGVAALNVRGQTVHRFFGFRIDVTPDKVRESRRAPRHPEIYKNVRTIIIDEASMLRADLLDCVDQFLRKHGPVRNRVFGGVQMAFVGDLYQLPPVVTRDEREIFRELYETPYFFSARALDRANLKIVELEKVYRQKDSAFVHLLNRVRNDTVGDDDVRRLNERTRAGFSPPDDGFYITLTATNRSADRINEARLAALPGRAVRSTARIAGEFGREYHPTAVELAFKPGAQVMMLNNDSDHRWVNGSVGVIEHVEEDEDREARVRVRLRDGDDLVSVEPYKWELIRFGFKQGAIVTDSIGSFTQLPFRLAWAITIHKSQGKTFDNVIIDLERGAFAAGQTYVALSRCTSFEGIVLSRPIKSSSIRADWRIQRFLTDYRYAEAERAMTTTDKKAAIRRAIDSNARIAMTYLKPNDTRSERVVVPLEVGTESYRGKQFLGMRAHCLLRGGERVFRVDRILKLEVRGE